MLSKKHHRIVPKVAGVFFFGVLDITRIPSPIADKLGRSHFDKTPLTGPQIAQRCGPGKEGAEGVAGGGPVRLGMGEPFAKKEMAQLRPLD